LVRAPSIPEIVLAAIAAGPPQEVGYGEENLGRYVHTVEWALAGAGARGGRLLDVGTYPGHLVMALREVLDAEVNGIGRFVPPGFRDQMAAHGVPVHDVDVEREFLPFADATFDRVLATEVLEHLAHPGLLLGECLRVLRPGGTLLLTTPNVVDLPNRLRALRGRSPQSHLFGIDEPFRMNEWVHRREYAPDEVRRLLRATGFGRVDIHTFTPPPAGRPGPWRLAHHLINRVPGLGGTVFALTAKPLGSSSSVHVDRARLAIDQEYVEVEAGAPVSLRVRAANVGTTAWTTGPGPGPVALGMHLLDVQGRTLDRDFARKALTREIRPGEALEVDFPFVAPATSGVFLVDIDLVREGQHWFGDDASPTVRAVLRAQEAAARTRTACR
jgi:SAM-dependent methyltransferase